MGFLFWAGADGGGLAGEGQGEGRKDKGPLAGFKEEDLADVGFCFQTFAEAVVKEDARLIFALLAEVPEELKKADPREKEGRARIARRFAAFKGAQIVKHQRIAAAGLATVTYQTPQGEAKECRMQNILAVWKIVP
jgi:hypothetical protein